MRATGILALLFAAALLAPSRAASPPAYHVIAHPNNSTTAVEKRFIADAFLKRVTRWGHDEQIRPVDQGPDSPARRRFSEEVLDRSVEAVKSYWQQQIFAGRDVPPPELDSDGEVLKYVLKHEGAIGYVSGGANVKGVRILTVK
jgi:ABC-type phosphate transport system substrate-binding protein